MGSLAQATGAGYPGVPPDSGDEKRHRRQITEVVNNILTGKMNNTGSLTITANAATTTLTDSRLGANSVVLLMPTTLNAAAALANVYFDTFTTGSCVAHHTNNAQTDRVFRYAVFA